MARVAMITTALIEAGVRTGRFRNDLEAATLLDALVGAVYIWLLLGLPLDQAWADKLPATLLHGGLRATANAASSERR